MNRYEQLRFVAKLSQTLQSEHFNVCHLGFSRSNVVYICGLKYPFC